MNKRILQVVTEHEAVGRGRVLVVDDDAFNRDLMDRRLTREGFVAVAVADGQAALDLLDVQPFDLVLLDLIMPGIDGRAVLEAIRATRSAAELPVIMLTSMDDGESIAECFRVGANDYVTKPFKVGALVARLDTHIARNRAETALKQAHEELERRVEQRTLALRQANAELIEAQNILAEALEAIDDGFVLWDANDRLVACNQRYRQLFGDAAAEVVQGARFRDLMRLQATTGLIVDARGRVEQWLAETIDRHANPGIPFEEALADGKWVRITESRSANGRVVGLYTDITEIKRREAALKEFAETNRQLAAAVNATSSAVLITDPRQPDNPIVFANPAFTAMTGWPVEEVIGRNRKILAGPQTDMNELVKLEVAIRQRRSAKAELCLHARDGRPFWAEVSASPIRDNDGVVSNWVIIQSDITARRETEEALFQSQKMEVIGQLSGGMAHDFNNLLTIVLGNLEFALGNEALRDEEIIGQLKVAMDAGRRGAELAKRMLAFARRQTVTPKITDLGRTVEGLRELLRRSLGSEYTIQTETEDDVWPVLVDRGQLENAILNLAVNARDAMPGGGSLTIDVANRRLDCATDVGGQPIPTGEYVCVGVSDTGHGMDPEVARQAVQPFFTTKEPGKGTGLGLSMVYGFLSQFGGYLSLESTPGRGTRIELWLPRKEAELDRESTESASEPSGGHERVLLVDDEPDVRAVAALQLKRLGYEVVEADDAHQALVLLDDGESFDLLITDIALPGGMSGIDLAVAARTRKSDVPVLYVSGYADAGPEPGVNADKSTQFLAKPYDGALLADAVRRALGDG